MNSNKAVRKSRYPGYNGVVKYRRYVGNRHVNTNQPVYICIDNHDL